MRAIITGSFDPITIGHLSLIKKASQIFDSVTVLLCVNFEKKTLFNFEQRLEILHSAISGLDNVSVDSHTGWLYEYLARLDGAVVFKGVRNAQDFEYEREMAEFNLKHSGVHTVFCAADPDLSEISSTKVRELLKSGGDWRSLIPQNAQKIVEKFYNNI